MRYTFLATILCTLAACEQTPGPTTPSSCTDGAKNGTETDVDCGGPGCDKCDSTRACLGPADCQTGLCTEFVCIAASCADKLKNAGETDLDCGGPSCAKCGDNLACAADADCQSGNCDTGRCLPAVSVTAIDTALGSTVGGNMVTLTGAGIRVGTTVSFGQVAATDVLVSPTQIKARVPAATVPDLVDVSVQVGGKRLVLAKAYRYYWTDVGTGTSVSHPLLGGVNQGFWVGDIDGDKRLDVLSASPAGGGGLSLFRGKAGGGFEARVDIAVGADSSRVAVADFNKDGKLDIAVTIPMTGTVGVLINNGDGTWKAPVSYTAGGTSVGLVAADFNGDGTVDLASANGGATPQISLFIGNGDAAGTFKAAANTAAASGAYELTVGDFNGDGKPDLACTTLGSNFFVSVFLNNGMGGLQAKVDYPTTSSTFRLAVADLNGDGKPDLAMTQFLGSQLGVLLNKGDGSGTFHAVAYTQLPSGQTNGVAASDVNRDGRMDVIVLTTMGALLLLGNGDGSFKAATLFAPGLIAGYGLAVTDFDGDGKLDVAGTTGNTMLYFPGTAM